LNLAVEGAAKSSGHYASATKCSDSDGIVIALRVRSLQQLEACCYFAANAAIIPTPQSLEERGMAAVCSPFDETVVSYQTVVLVEDAERFVNPVNVPHVSAELKLSQTATIKSLAFVVAVVPVGQLVLDVLATLLATLSTKFDAHDVVVR
jgi:hypothetical protein